jgi:hypothetical protein
MLLLLASGSISKGLLLHCIGLFPTEQSHVDFMILSLVLDTFLFESMVEAS